MISFSFSFQCKFKIDILDQEVDMDAITAEVIGPSGPVQMNLDLNGGHGTFTTEEMGMHEVLVKNEGETIRGAPHFLRSMPMSKKDYDGKKELILLYSSSFGTLMRDT